MAPPSLNILGGVSPSRQQTRLLAVALFLILVFFFLGNSNLATEPHFSPTTDADLPPDDFSHAAAKDPAVQSPPAHDTGEGDAHEAEDENGPRVRPPQKELAGQDARESRRPGSSQSHVSSPHPSPSAAVLDSPRIAPPAVDIQQPPKDKQACVPFEHWMRTRPGPPSEGKRQFPYVRPPPECRTFSLPAMETLIEEVKAVIKDPDLARLFENAYPMTLDTMVKWRGFANESDPDTGEWTTTDQELSYIITGDIDAMWLRDSASQIYSYLPLLEPSTEPDSLASLWRGLINSHARYIVISPYCHSFQPPPESGIPPTTNGAYTQNKPMPPYDPVKVFDCKWELDSLASFLQISAAYYEKTGDYAFFERYQWLKAVEAAVRAAGAMRLGTYAKDGQVEKSAWTFTGWTNRGSETLTNDGLGNPSKENGMVRTAFRPSDDATIYQFLVPANMMFASYLEAASEITNKLEGELAANLTVEMRDFAQGIRQGIDKDAIIERPEFGPIFAYEVDGFGSANLMDDANVPSLLAMPLWNFTKGGEGNSKKGKSHDYREIYRNTRKFVLSEANPYFMRGPAISAVGGPHVGPGKAWPMAAVVAALTAFEEISGLKDVEAAVEEQVRMVLDSTTGSGVLHESVNSWNEGSFTRAWFGWANGLFGELVLKMHDEKSGRSLLGKSWQ